MLMILKEENPEDKLYPDLVDIRKNFKNQSVWRINCGMEELVREFNFRCFYLNDLSV